MNSGINKDVVKINGIEYKSIIKDSIINLDKSDMIYLYKYHRKIDTLIMDNEIRQGKVTYKFISVE